MDEIKETLRYFSRPKIEMAKKGIFTCLGPYVMRRMMLCADASKKNFRPSFKNKHRGCESTLKTSAKREKKNTVCFSLHYLYTV